MLRLSTVMVYVRKFNILCIFLLLLILQHFKNAQCAHLTDTTKVMTITGTTESLAVLQVTSSPSLWETSPMTKDHVTQKSIDASNPPLRTTTSATTSSLNKTSPKPSSSLNSESVPKDNLTQKNIKKADSPPKPYSSPNTSTTSELNVTQRNINESRLSTKSTSSPKTPITLKENVTPKNTNTSITMLKPSSSPKTSTTPIPSSSTKTTTTPKGNVTPKTIKASTTSPKPYLSPTISTTPKDSATKNMSAKPSLSPKSTMELNASAEPSYSSKISTTPKNDATQKIINTSTTLPMPSSTAKTLTTPEGRVTQKSVSALNPSSKLYLPPQMSSMTKPDMAKKNSNDSFTSPKMSTTTTPTPIPSSSSSSTLHPSLQESSKVNNDSIPSSPIPVVTQPTLTLQSQTTTTTQSPPSSSSVSPEMMINKRYCDPALCEFYNGTHMLIAPHVACQNDGTFAEACGQKPHLIYMSDRRRNLIVDIHNLARVRIASGEVEGYEPAAHMPLLKWDTELEYIATLHVKRCQFDHDQCRNTPRYLYSGQNIGYFWIGREFTSHSKRIKSFILNWFNEHRDANQSFIDSFHMHPEKKKIGHFTMMVADRAHRIGCAAVHYRDPYQTDLHKFLMTCNYDYTNVIDEPIYQSGPTASKCKYKISEKYPSLCDWKEAVYEYDEDDDQQIQKENHINLENDENFLDNNVK